jgi:hypothetical protein
MRRQDNWPHHGIQQCGWARKTRATLTVNPLCAKVRAPQSSAETRPLLGPMLPVLACLVAVLALGTVQFIAAQTDVAIRNPYSMVDAVVPMLATNQVRVVFARRSVLHSRCCSSLRTP